MEVVDKLSSSDTESSGQICDQNRENPVRSRVNTLDLTGYKLRPAIRSDLSFIFLLARFFETNFSEAAYKLHSSKKRGMVTLLSKYFRVN